MQSYKYRKNAGALQEAALPAPPAQSSAPPEADLDDSYVSAHNTSTFARSEVLAALAAQAPVRAQSRGGAAGMLGGGIGTVSTPPSSRPSRSPRPPAPGQGHLEISHWRGSMFFYTVEDGQRVLVVAKDGAMDVVEGPKRIFRWGKTIRSMQHHVAHPGDFLIVRFRDGKQDHLRGPAHVWLDPRVHSAIAAEEIFRIAERESIVVYSKDKETGEVHRRIEHGPMDFMPQPGEWLHTFSWHGTQSDGKGGSVKVPNGMVFQKLWLLPDQMYHDVPEVRTADGAVLTIRLMIFFELRDIERMLKTTHDPIGDFVNAATSDVVEVLSKRDFEGFLAHIEELNDLATYKQLTGRAAQCGYHIDKVVYRGYGAPPALQQMHEQALESRTRLQLEKDTERQAQELADLKLERRLGRDAKERQERAANQAQELTLEGHRRQAALDQDRAARQVQREQDSLDNAARIQEHAAQQAAELERLQALSGMGVDLTTLLARQPADRVIELRGGPANVHLDGG